MSQTQSMDEMDSLADAKKMIQELRDKISSQARQLLAWRRAYKMQEVFISRLHHQKEDQLKYLSSKLLLFESRLLRKQIDISAMLTHREKIIHRQQRLIEILTNRLIDNGLDPPISDLTELDTNLLDLESLNDSDSAVVMEDIDSENFMAISKYKSNSFDSVTIARSISDAIDPNLKYVVRRNNCYLRRPEILETVYSVEEDADNESVTNQNNVVTPTTDAANRRRDAFASGSEKAILVQDPQEGVSSKQPASSSRKGSCCSSNGSMSTSSNCSSSSISMSSTRDGREREKVQSTTQVTTYNRVMSNHRNVTKPKDVKYKRINKAKSKSLEELRGRLKNWVEQGTKFAGLSLEHSHSYA